MTRTRIRDPHGDADLRHCGRRTFLRAGASGFAAMTIPRWHRSRVLAADAPSNVPMTRPQELLAVHQTNFFHSSTFVQLADGRILHAAGTRFTTSADGGLTWSAPFEKRDANGERVGGGGTSLVRLAGRGIGLAA